MLQVLTPFELVNIVIDKNNDVRISGPEPRVPYQTPYECIDKFKSSYIWIVLSDNRLSNVDDFQLTIVNRTTKLSTSYQFEAKFVSAASNSNSYALRLRESSSDGDKVEYRVAEARSNKFSESENNEQYRVVFDPNFLSFQSDLKLQPVREAKKKYNVRRKKAKRLRDESESPSSGSEYSSKESPPRKFIKNIPSSSSDVSKIVEPAPVQEETTKQYRRFFIQHLCDIYTTDIEKRVRQDLDFDVGMRSKPLKIVLTIEEL